MLPNPLATTASPATQFLKGRCKVQVGAQTRVADLYDAYRSWCKDHSDHVITGYEFMQRVEANGHPILCDKYDGFIALDIDFMNPRHSDGGGRGRSAETHNPQKPSYLTITLAAIMLLAFLGAAAFENPPPSNPSSPSNPWGQR